jgi:hypothetical protein
MTSTECRIVNDEDNMIDEQKQDLSNRGKVWSEDETLQLLQNIRKKKTHQEIALEHKRTASSIASRLRHLAAEYHKEGRSIETIMKFTGLTEEAIKEAIQRREVGNKIREQKKKEKAAQPASKSYIQQKITSFTEAEPTMKEVIVILKDIQMKLDFLLLHPSHSE